MNAAHIDNSKTKNKRKEKKQPMNSFFSTYMKIKTAMQSHPLITNSTKLKARRQVFEQVASN